MTHYPKARLLSTCACAVAVMLYSHQSQASPYASGITNDNGTINFVLNEGGGTVDVVFEDNTTNSLLSLPTTLVLPH